MAYNTKNITRDAAGAPVPQYFSPTNDQYEAIQGEGGKQHVRASELETLLSQLQTLITSIKDTTGIKKITDAVTIGSSALPTGAATAAKQDIIISHVDGIEGLITTLNGYVDGLEKALSNKYVGYSTTAKPTITNYQAGVEYTFLELDTGNVYTHDGAKWVVI